MCGQTYGGAGASHSSVLSSFPARHIVACRYNNAEGISVLSGCWGANSHTDCCCLPHLRIVPMDFTALTAVLYRHVISICCLCRQARDVSCLTEAREEGHGLCQLYPSVHMQGHPHFCFPSPVLQPAPHLSSLHQNAMGANIPPKQQ